MTDTDIIHEDPNCTIYRPGSGKGVLISTYVPKSNEINVDENGLMSNREALKKNLTERNRPYLNDVVFFGLIPFAH